MQFSYLLDLSPVSWGDLLPGCTPADALAGAGLRVQLTVVVVAVPLPAGVLHADRVLAVVAQAVDVPVLLEVALHVRAHVAEPIVAGLRLGDGAAGQAAGGGRREQLPGAGVCTGTAGDGAR